MPTASAPMDNAHAGPRCAAVVDRQRGAGGARRARSTPSARSQLWPRALRRRPGGPRPARRTSTAARAALEECGQPDGFSTVARRRRTCRAASTSPTRSPAELAEVGIEVEVRPLDADTFYATDVGDPANVAADGLRPGAGHLDGRLPDAGVLPGAAGRRPQHPDGRQHELRAAGRPGLNALIDDGPRGRRPGERRRRGAQVAAAARGPRPTCRWPRPGCSSRRAAVAQRRGDAAVQRLRPRHRRRPLSVG